MPFERREKSRHRRNGLKDLGKLTMNSHRVDKARNAVKLRALSSSYR
jgi:hypothetical protein